jgi:two-component system, chemotaxis family, protein-glutamate methylesterase/glutaminase
MAEHGAPIRNRHLYLAIPDKHLLVKGGVMLFGSGPTENRWRPSIDALFRSAAAAYNSRVIGIVLTGMLNDGTAGMIAIKKCGGTSIVQDPAQAEYSEMPESVLQNTAVDYCVKLEQMGTLLREKTINGIPEPHEVPSEVKLEAEIAEKAIVNMDILKDLANHSVFTCPDCGGGLWEMKNEGISRYRCHTGHVYTQDEFDLKQQDALEGTLWVALRMMEERKQLMDKMAKEEKNKGWVSTAEKKHQRAEELTVHIERLKQLLFDTKKV